MALLSDYWGRLPAATRGELVDDVSSGFGFSVKNKAKGVPRSASDFSFLGGTSSWKEAIGVAKGGGSVGAIAKGFGKAAWRGAIPLAGAYFTASAGLEGFQTGGVRGAVTGIGKEVVYNALAMAAFRGAAPAAAAAAPYLAAGAAVGAGALVLGTAGYMGASASWQYHMQQKPLETAGSLMAFQTSGAATMRQRSVANIQRSHMNARSAFSNEAEYAHIARYRGIGRRGTR